MPIVDAQVHIWAANTPERPWPEEQIVKPHRPEPFSKDNLLEEMNAAGVQRAVLVTPMWEGFRNDLVLEAAQAHPDQFAVMGRFEPELPASRGQMATWREQVGMLGLRLVLRHPPFRPILSEG
ncbi:MAG: amidohydrolase, partial [Nitrospinaceae bacterium]|nr:amidohydrolase [Nitrospinaceae bacterium]